MMKKVTVLLAIAATAIGLSCPAKAERLSTTPVGQQLTGQIESVDGTTVTVKTTAGDTQVYTVDPNLISTLKLGAGSEIVIDGTRLQSGRIVALDANTAEVLLDGSGTENTYILTQVSRRYLAVGDRVVITPNLQVVRADTYVLSASDLRLRSVALASSSSYSSESRQMSTSRQTNIGGGEVRVQRPIAEPVAPIRGMW